MNGTNAALNEIVQLESCVYVKQSTTNAESTIVCRMNLAEVEQVIELSVFAVLVYL